MYAPTLSFSHTPCRRPYLSFSVARTQCMHSLSRCSSPQLPSQFIDPSATAEPSPSDETSYNGISRTCPICMTSRNFAGGKKWRNISFRNACKNYSDACYTRAARTMEIYLSVDKECEDDIYAWCRNKVTSALCTFP